MLTFRFYNFPIVLIYLKASIKYFSRNKSFHDKSNELKFALSEFYIFYLYLTSLLLLDEIN